MERDYGVPRPPRSDGPQQAKKDQPSTKGVGKRRSKANGRLDSEAGWRAKLIIDQHGKPKALLANAIIAFRDAPQWADVLWFDAFHNRTTVRGATPWPSSAGPDRAWTDTDDTRATEWLQHAGIQVKSDIAGQAAEAVARDRRFHPVLDYLNRCQWDGVPRLDTWATDYLGVEDSPYVRAVASRWMISAIARVYEPGCKADCALILEGQQGLLKSTALRTLGVPWYTDDIADLGTKDSALQLAGVWIVELPELDSIRRSDVAKIKAFMSRRTDRFRPPYGRRVIEQPRQCVFAGTVNGDEYLRDETGGRRFWPIVCTAIDIPRLVADRDQLWGEARARYLAGEPWWLDTAELDAAASEEQSGRYQADVWQERIAKFVELRPSVTVDEILGGALNIAVKDRKPAEVARVSQCLRALGWKRRQIRRGELRGKWRYVPPESGMEPEEPPLVPFSGSTKL